MQSLLIALLTAAVALQAAALTVVPAALVWQRLIH